MVLGREDVARDPAHVGAQVGEGLDQDGGLHRHVQRPHDPGPRQRLATPVLLANRHQPRHLVLGQPDLLASELGQAQVPDLERLASGLAGGAEGMNRCGYGSHWSRSVFEGRRHRAAKKFSRRQLRVALAANSVGPLGLGVGRQRHHARGGSVPPPANHSASCSGAKPSQRWPISWRYCSRSCGFMSTSTSRPPGLSTRATSRSATSGSGTRWSTRKSTAASSSRSSSGSASSSPVRISTLVQSREPSPCRLQHGRRPVHRDDPRHERATAPRRPGRCPRPGRPRSTTGRAGRAGRRQGLAAEQLDAEPVPLARRRREELLRSRRPAGQHPLQPRAVVLGRRGGDDRVLDQLPEPPCRGVQPRGRPSGSGGAGRRPGPRSSPRRRGSGGGGSRCSGAAAAPRRAPRRSAHAAPARGGSGSWCCRPAR